MLDRLKLEHILFLDIETVPQHESYDQMDERWKQLWDKKSLRLAKDGEDSANLYDRAGIYAEFGKIVCISVGYLNKKGKDWNFRIKSFYGKNEKKLLEEFCDLLNSNFSDSGKSLCAHNGKEFDFPYLGRRILINGLKLPYILDLAGKKPWEVSLLDTMELWKFGDYKSFTSLDLLSASFDLPSPKDDMDGSMVYPVFYKEKNGLEKIKTYCEKDIITLLRVLLKMTGNEDIEETNIVYLSKE
ncbi:MAG: 3'-5' exonuclease [Flavobacteriales bacterium]|nr:3'-5' exonuclease [Flavobacteriales bacterium]